jgi:hypothetical protein
MGGAHEEWRAESEVVKKGRKTGITEKQDEKERKEEKS